MPNASKYPGPADALLQYRAAVEASAADVAVKGAKIPYTSRNGHMFSFLDADGSLAMRLPDDLRADFEREYETHPVVQYGAVMRGYVAIPPGLLADERALASWFDRAYQWIGTLPPKSANGKR